MDWAVKKEMKVQTRKSFTLTSEFQLFGWNIPLLYPEQEYVIGVFLKGYGPGETDEYKSKASLLGVTATFKKNFCLLLNQAGIEVDKPFYRVRADASNLLGNAETDWYGWSDTANAPRKKYLQSSAFSF